MNAVPAFIWVVEIAAITGGVAAVCAALYAGARATGRDEAGAARLVALAGLLLVGWMVVAAGLASVDVFRQYPDEAVPWIGVAIVGSFAFWLLAARLPAVSAALADPAAPARLAGVQTFRVVGGVFLLLMALGFLPAAFALPAGLGDMAIGLAAPFVAVRLARHPDRVRGAIWFNLLGLFDLVVAVGIGFLAATEPLRVLDLSPSTTALALLPLVLVPTVAVPLAAALHVVSLRRLTRPAAVRQAAGGPVAVHP
ncbi:hypothetical protein [Pseudonocardia sp. H11422]|uniref:hypothetical protein n=1 Tax=Pseudonocardia sp. H11422 TaxID=2835866 RepID=UPI001BDBD585|nr:hypothetical protein [Pseudonocardia sp. H11422]